MLNCGVRRIGRGARSTSTRRSCAAKSTRSTRSSTPTSTTASIAAGLAKSQAAYEESFRQTVRRARRTRNPARPAALAGRRPLHRSRSAAVPDAGALRHGLLRAVQMQSAAARRLPQSVELYARDLPDAGGRRDRRFRADQAQAITAACATSTTASCRWGPSSISPRRTTAPALPSSVQLRNATQLPPIDRNPGAERRSGPARGRRAAEPGKTAGCPRLRNTRPMIIGRILPRIAA